MHEKVNGQSVNETTLLLISGKRLNDKWSAFSMIGNRFVYGRSPQIHALMAKDFKLQAGFGTAYDGYRFAPITAFRFIKEFNNGYSLRES